MFSVLNLLWKHLIPPLIMDTVGIFPPGQMEIALMCEIVPWKAAYLEKAFDKVPLFRDMKELGGGKAYEVRSKCPQKVPKARC